jgi:hypothetical protein
MVNIMDYYAAVPLFAKHLWIFANPLFRYDITKEDQCQIIDAILDFKF